MKFNGSWNFFPEKNNNKFPISSNTYPDIFVFFFCSTWFIKTFLYFYFCIMWFTKILTFHTKNQHTKYIKIKIPEWKKFKYSQLLFHIKNMQLLMFN